MSSSISSISFSQIVSLPTGSDAAIAPGFISDSRRQVEHDLESSKDNSSQRMKAVTTFINPDETLLDGEKIASRIKEKIKRISASDVKYSQTYLLASIIVSIGSYKLKENKVAQLAQRIKIKRKFHIYDLVPFGVLGPALFNRESVYRNKIDGHPICDLILQDENMMKEGCENFRRAFWQDRNIVIDIPIGEDNKILSQESVSLQTTHNFGLTALVVKIAGLFSASDDAHQVSLHRKSFWFSRLLNKILRENSEVERDACPVQTTPGKSLSVKVGKSARPAVVLDSEDGKKSLDGLIECFNKEIEDLLASANDRSLEEFKKSASELSDNLVEIEKGCQQSLVVCDLAQMYAKMKEVVKIIDQRSTPLLTESDVSQLRALSSISEDLHITPSEKAFFPPKIPSFNLLLSFEKFKRRWNYSGISIDTPVQEIYGKIDENRVFTALYFRKSDSLVFRVSYWASTTSKLVLGVKDDEEGELRDYVAKRYDKWGYDAFEVGNVSNL